MNRNGMENDGRGTRIGCSVAAQGVPSKHLELVLLSGEDTWEWDKSRTKKNFFRKGATKALTLP